MTYVHLNPSDVPDHLRGDYTGRTFKAHACTEMTIPSTAGLWDGGSCDRYHFIDLATGKSATMPGQHTSPWNGSRRDITVKLVPGYAVVMRTFFQGVDMGLTFYVHPDNAAKLLPAAVELTRDQWLVLDITARLISSARADERLRFGMSRETWDHTRGILHSMGLLTKIGAITPAGRNACNANRALHSKAVGS